MLLFNFLWAQNEDDALRYSATKLGGTARNVALGGAFGALGSDFSSLSINPGGLALYRKSEFTLTPSITSSTTKSNYMGGANDDNKVQFMMGNGGIVLAGTRESKKDKWKGFAFGIGYNRLNNFGSRTIIEGTNITNSLTDVYLANVKGKPRSGFSDEAYMAWNTYLIDTIPGDTSNYYSQMPSGINKLQRKTIERRGGMGETVISFAGNYDNKLFIGGTIGFQKVRYWEEATYDETAVNDTFNLRGFRRKDYLNTDGNGVDFKFGVIYMPVKFMRVGLAFHSPTYLRLKDNYSSTLTTTFKSGASYTAGVDDNGSALIGNFDYRITTPYRAIGSLAFIIGQYGLISADYEFVDYRESNISALGDYSFSDANNNISEKYKATANIRIGGEVRLDPFSIRLGYANYGSPFKNASLKTAQNSFSGGVGYRKDGLFLDLAYVYSSYSDKYYLYDSSINPTPSINKITRGAIVTTFGYKF